MNKFYAKEGEIAYKVDGIGPRNFLLIHNSGGSHEMMHHTSDYFSQSGKVITPDLLGHGASASPKIEYTLTLFAENLLELCEYEKGDIVKSCG
jgi:pimeloyl-ACP methyl ester carboxylesterase